MVMTRATLEKGDISTPTCVLVYRGGWYYVYLEDSTRFEVGPFRSADLAVAGALLDDEVSPRLDYYDRAVNAEVFGRWPVIVT